MNLEWIESNLDLRDLPICPGSEWTIMIKMNFILIRAKRIFVPSAALPLLPHSGVQAYNKDDLRQCCQLPVENF